MICSRSEFLQLGKRRLQRLRLSYLTHCDAARFSHAAAYSPYDVKQDQVTSRIIYNVHALEKGLARMRDRRLGFGKTALSGLNASLAVYRQQGYDPDSFAFREGLSVINRYRDLHRENYYDDSFLERIVERRFLEDGLAIGGSRVRKLGRQDKAENSSKNFYELAQGRASVREFSGGGIDESLVIRAIENAEKTPSVCNRQAWRVHWVSDKETSRRVLLHQRGFGYSQMPEVLIAITASYSTYISPVERNQAFVDGGLFAMSVLYGLEHEGLAAVPLNAMMYQRDEKAVRSILRIDDSEVFIMFIAIGEFPEDFIVPISHRKPIGDILFFNQRFPDAQPLESGN